jgi:hypothetical protein
MTLKYDDIIEAVRKVEALMPQREPSLFDLTFKPPSFAGMKLFEESPPPPKIQVRDIKLKDGTSILSKEFRDETNAWLAAEFGYHESLCKDRMFLVSGLGIIAGPKHVAMLRNFTA